MGEIYEAVFTVQAGWAHAGRLISRRRPGAATNRCGRPLAILLRPSADDAPCMCPPGLMKVYHHTPRERLPAPDTERTFGGDSRAGNLGWACSRRHGSPQPTTTLTTSGWDDRNDAGQRVPLALGGNWTLGMQSACLWGREQGGRSTPVGYSRVRGRWWRCGWVGQRRGGSISAAQWCAGYRRPRREEQTGGSTG